MKNYKFLSIIFLFLLAPVTLFSATAFKVVVLGCHGGPKENNLSSYLIAPRDANDFIACDAGTLLSGIYIAKGKNSFDDIKINSATDQNFEIEIFRNHIKAYFISHAHIDHVSGLIINSTVDEKKPIYGLDSTISIIRDNLFNWRVWPNFGSEGTKPLLNQYDYRRLKINEKIVLESPKMTVEPFLLSHPDGYQSTAFLIESSDSYVVYFGDTNSDAIEKEKNIEKVWKKIAPLISENKLRAIFLECSFSEKVPESQLFGHLNSKYLIEELKHLAKLVDPNNFETALKNIKIIVTHIKETFLKEGSAEQTIKQELEKLNTLNLQFIFPQQGERLDL